MWVNLAEDTGVYSRLLSRLEDDDNGYNIAIDTLVDGACKLIVRVKKGGVDMFVKSIDPVLTLGEFHHIAFAFNELETDPTLRTTLWVDGVAVEVEDTSGAGGVQGSPNFVLGRGTASSAEMSGILDEVNFYTGLLTADGDRRPGRPRRNDPGRRSQRRRYGFQCRSGYRPRKLGTIGHARRLARRRCQRRRHRYQWRSGRRPRELGEYGPCKRRSRAVTSLPVPLRAWDRLYSGIVKNSVFRV